MREKEVDVENRYGTSCIPYMGITYTPYSVGILLH